MIIESSCATIQKLCSLFEQQTKSDIERLQQQVNVRAAQLVEEIDKIGDEMITEFATEVFKQQKLRTAELERCRQSVNNEIAEMFTDVVRLTEESKKCLKLGESLLKTASPADLKRNVFKFKQFQATLIDQADAPRPEIFNTLSLSEPMTLQLNSLDIGHISRSDVVLANHTGKTKLKMPFETGDWINRMSYSLKHDQTITAITEDDKQSPCLTSIVVLESETSNKIIAVDSDNKCVKLFCPQTKRCESVYRTDGKPHGLAKLKNQELVLVSLPHDQTLLYLNVRHAITLRKSVKTKKEYYNIAVLPGDNMAATVGWSGCVEVMDQSLNVIRCLSRTLIPIPDCLAAKCDSLVIVSQRDQTVTCVTSSGKVVWVSSDPGKLQYLRGVTVDVDEFVYACDYKRNAIVQFSRDGEIVRDVITQNDGLTQPWVVCCDQDKLYVGQINGDIKIFTWSFD